LWRHASVALPDQNVVVEDLGSRNGTFVGIDRIKSRELTDSDVLAIADSGGCHSRLRWRSWPLTRTIALAPEVILMVASRNAHRAMDDGPSQIVTVTVLNIDNPA
jgi:hypothetical protein